MAVDKKGFVYLGQYTVHKYDPKTGKMLGRPSRARHAPDGKRLSRRKSKCFLGPGPGQRRACGGIYYRAPAGAIALAERRRIQRPPWNELHS